MKTEIYSIDHPEVLSKANAVLEHGGLIAFPTDTVYGLAAKIDNIPGINKIYSVKGRDFSKAIPVLIGDFSQLGDVALEVNKNTRLLIKNFWPGALTLVVLKQPGLPQILSSYQTVGIRMPDYQPALQLLKITGPLAVTSANLSGEKNTTSASQVMDQLNGKIELIIDGSDTPGEIASTVVDCTKEKIEILREGLITKNMLDTLLNQQSKE